MQHAPYNFMLSTNHTKPHLPKWYWINGLSRAPKNRVEIPSFWFPSLWVNFALANSIPLHWALLPKKAKSKWLRHMKVTWVLRCESYRGRPPARKVLIWHFLHSIKLLLPLSRFSRSKETKANVGRLLQFLGCPWAVEIVENFKKLCMNCFFGCNATLHERALISKLRYVQCSYSFYDHKRFLVKASHSCSEKSLLSFIRKYTDQNFGHDFCYVLHSCLLIKKKHGPFDSETFTLQSKELRVLSTVLAK